MKAIILAGGKGTRLAPYTTVFPKPLVPLGHRPIIDIIVHQLAHYGFTDVTMTVGPLSELIQAYFHHANGITERMKFSYVKETKPTGTVGSLSAVNGLNETFLVMNGDVLTTLDYAKLIAYHKEKGGLLTVGMHKKNVKIDFGVIEVDENFQIMNYQEKPENSYPVSMGVYVFEPEVLKYIQPGEYLDFPVLVERLLEKGEKVVGYPCEDFWLDIGCHEDYQKAQDIYESMKDKFLPSK
jgi:NDP-mannose synthase